MDAEPIPSAGPDPGSRLPRRLARAVGALVALTLIGTLGFMAVEGMRPLDALYMTVITISTVGYHEVTPLGTGGRLFTMALIVVGVGTALYLLAAMAELVLEGRLRDFLGRTAMQHRIEQLRGHVIVCGHGRLGRVVAEELRRSGVPLVIIDADPDKEAELAPTGALYLIGSALDDDVLERAGVRRARAVVAATPSDAHNVFITLSAREKNPEVRVHARGESDAGLRHLRLAGAHQVVSAYQTGGARLAASIVRPSVVDFVEIEVPGREDELEMVEVRVAPGSPLDGQDVRGLEQAHPRLRVVALTRQTDPVRLMPEGTTAIAEGDLLLVVGAPASLGRVAQSAQGAAP
jgi:voltage-gated potassium channel